MVKKFFYLVALVVVLALGYYFRDKDNSNSFSKILNTDSTKSEVIPVAIIPHFEFATDKRDQMLKNIGKINKPGHAVIVSVNHFNSGDSNILLADREWQINSGKLTSDKEIVQKIANDGGGKVDNSAFENEHGIKNVLAPVYSNIARDVIPIIIKDTTKKEEVDKLIDAISNNCTDCILIASVDFSHYCPRTLASIHDTYSISALNNLDFDKTWQAETDSPQTLYLAEKLADKSNTRNFHLFYNGNSGDPSKTDDAEVTSVIDGYYSSAVSDQKIEPASTFVIAGDAMFDRNVWQTFKTTGLNHIFDNFGTRVFRGTDLAAINLEGPVSPKTIPGIQTGSMVFNFQPEVPATLKYLNIDAVSLANNHTNNAGATGFVSTKTMLDKSGIKYFGQPSGFDKDASVLRIEGEIPLTIIGIMTLDSFDKNGLEAKIKSEKSAGRTVIVFPHWGTEYAPVHSASQKNMAKSWIAAGADIIIGSHPHVTEDFELVKPFDSAQGKPVVYSLGNFVFDQFFSQETQEGLVIAGKVTKDKIRLSFLPTVEKTIKPQFMAGTDKINKIKTILDINSQNGFTKLSSDTIEVAR